MHARGQEYGGDVDVAAEAQELVLDVADVAPVDLHFKAAAEAAAQPQLIALRVSHDDVGDRLPRGQRAERVRRQFVKPRIGPGRLVPARRRSAPVVDRRRAGRARLAPCARGRARPCTRGPPPGQRSTAVHRPRTAPGRSMGACWIRRVQRARGCCVRAAPGAATAGSSGPDRPADRSTAGGFRRASAP